MAVICSSFTGMEMKKASYPSWTASSTCLNLESKTSGKTLKDAWSSHAMAPNSPKTSHAPGSPSKVLSSAKRQKDMFAPLLIA